MASERQMWLNQREKWRAEALKAMGKNKAEIVATIGRALKAAVSKRTAKRFRETMDITGAGNNLAVIKVFYELARRLDANGRTDQSPRGQANRKPCRRSHVRR